MDNTCADRTTTGNTLPESTAKEVMKIFEVDFESVYPVGCGLIIAAISKESALKIAKKKIIHKQEEP